jgi:hypothetical protein
LGAASASIRACGTYAGHNSVLFDHLFYINPRVTLGLTPASKASWGEFPHYSNLTRMAVMTGMMMISATGGMYVSSYNRLRRGERLTPVKLWMYPLVVGSTACGALAYYALKVLLAY